MVAVSKFNGLSQVKGAIRVRKDLPMISVADLNCYVRLLASVSRYVHLEIFHVEVDVGIT